ncbi:MAG: putative RecA/RadA family phage recombinase [Halioglobus sp.]|jgi:predicted RecA/RadA family phage recombinase
MSANYKQVGNTLQYSNAGSAISSGDVVVVGDLVGIAETAIDATTGVGTVNVEGVFEVACNTADVIAAGQTLVWDASASEFVDANTPASGDNTGGVVAFTAAGTGVVLVEVKLLPGSGATTA